MGNKSTVVQSNDSGDERNGEENGGFAGPGFFLKPVSQTRQAREKLVFLDRVALGVGGVVDDPERAFGGFGEFQVRRVDNQIAALIGAGAKRKGAQHIPVFFVHIRNFRQHSRPLIALPEIDRYGTNRLGIDCGLRPGAAAAIK